MNNIHSQAIVHENANLGDNIEIGPFCIIGEHVKLGDNCKLHSNVVIEGHTTIGKNNEIFHSAVIGSKPQDLKYDGAPTKVIIGDFNQIREFVTINPGTDLKEDTEIGNHNLLMTHVHIGHQSHIGNHVIIANSVNIAGHIHIHDYAIIGGDSAIHQFVKVGTHAFVGGFSGIKKDVPPYTRGEGFPYKAHGLNSTGLLRKGFSKESIKSLKELYKLFYKSGLNFSDALKEAKKIPNPTSEQQKFIEFVEEAKRGICKG